MSDELASTLASSQEFMAGIMQILPLGISHDVPCHLSDHCEIAPPPTITMSSPIVTTTDDTRLAEQEAKVEIFESRMRQIRLQDGGLTWDDSTVMRAHEIDDAQLVDFFPMSLSGTTQRWFALVDISRLCTWEDVANEFLTQFAFSTDIDVSRRELEATRQMPDKFISSFVNRWRDLKSLVQVAFSVEEVIARGL
ncbi:hypothetical protein CK203_107885 [Vitis vinifera]|uniref:Retrotransposon gag domain-containing protein n=1 Tax=Vitis vinifera TaxID=29760 RepID=A0A438FEW2_VITVI|nr:hypothetical protein CK203_107885 [Vitis vinifera]